MSVRLNRMTTEYNAVEDRIRISGDTENGPCIIWVSQRLAQRLVLELFKWLEAGPQLVNSDQSPEEKAKQAQKKASPMDQLMAQQSASAAIKPQKSVEVHTDTEQWLATAVDVKMIPEPEAIYLNFKSQQNHQAHLLLSKAVVRQWLAIVHKGYMAGDWPMTVWPDWFMQAEQKEVSKPRQLH